jgi:hypothetical protein
MSATRLGELLGTAVAAGLGVWLKNPDRIFEVALEAAKAAELTGEQAGAGLHPVG